MQSPPPPSVWEKFLHKKTICVLLVETDEYTRRDVTAVLRRCKYQDPDFAPRLPAYFYPLFPYFRLQSSLFLFCLVITAGNGQQAWEHLHSTPTGIDLVLTEMVPGLLDGMMAHSVYKNIPVVITMSTAFECVSKGSADFLIKLIRSNELLNLWQHVWRRCHSSSGSWSGSICDITESESGDESNNSSGSNDRNGDTSMGLNVRNDSDNSSGTQAQSSWTKRAVEIDSSQDMSPDQSAYPADSTCAHVIHPQSEICSNRLLPDEFKGKGLEIGGHSNLNTDNQSSPNGASPPRKNSEGTIMEYLEKPLVRTADLIGSMAKNMDAGQAARGKDSPNCSSKVPEGKETDCDGVMLSLELSLKRPRSTGDGANAIQEEQRNVFRRSDLSAFAGYNTCVVSNQGRAWFMGSCSPYGNSSEAAKTDCTYNNMKSSSDAGLMMQGSNGSSNNNNMASTRKNVETKPCGNKVSPINGKTHTSAFHRVQQWTAVAAGKDKADEVGKKNAAGGKDKAGEAESKHPCAVHVGNAGSAGVPQSNVTDPSAPVEGHAANYGSNSGSNNNTNNGSTAETGGVDKRSCNIMYLKRERRVAALNRLIEKRKELSFGKKVRYQNRKREAEQRPRVRGKFVRQLPPATAAVER